MAVRPEGKRRINRPSDVMPVTRLRTEWVRPRGESVTEPRLAGARLADDATGFFLFSAADRLAVVGGGSVFTNADEFVAVSVEAEAEVSGVAAAGFSAGLVGAVSWD